jgi:hypothetical protein
MDVGAPLAFHQHAEGRVSSSVDPNIAKRESLPPVEPFMPLGAPSRRTTLCRCASLLVIATLLGALPVCLESPWHGTAAFADSDKGDKGKGGDKSDHGHDSSGQGSEGGGTDGGNGKGKGKGKGGDGAEGGQAADGSGTDGGGQDSLDSGEAGSGVGPGGSGGEAGPPAPPAIEPSGGGSIEKWQPVRVLSPAEEEDIIRKKWKK